VHDCPCSRNVILALGLSESVAIDVLPPKVSASEGLKSRVTTARATVLPSLAAA